eukprot:scaffold375_cov299-Chaetoceros_neogracile.AAC.27
MIADLFQVCLDEKWPEVRDYLSSDAAEEEKKSNVMYRGDNGRTCLHHACYLGAPDDIVKAMVDIAGKELVMMIDKNDRTALHRACWNVASYNIIKMLINVGGKDLVMAKDNDGDTALHDLCRRIKKHTKAYKIIKLILKVGDNNLLLSTKNHDGKTPLEIATASRGASEKSKAFKKIMKLLTLQVNSTNNNNNKTSANFIVAENGNISTPITQSNEEEQQDTRNFSTNTNNDPKDTTRQKVQLQRQLKVSQRVQRNSNKTTKQNVRIIQVLKRAWWV